MKPFLDRHCGLYMGYMQSRGMAYGSLDRRKVVRKKLGSHSRDEKEISLDQGIRFNAFSKTDRRTFWLKEVLFSNKRDILWFIESKESCMKKKSRSWLKR